MTILSSLLLDVSTGLAVALFVVLPVLGLAIGGAAAYVILQKIAKKKSEQSSMRPRSRSRRCSQVRRRNASN